MKLIKSSELIIHDDPKNDLFVVIAIDKNKDLPALGGTRYIEYKSKKEAINDAISLSRAMTKKISVANLRYTGGKAVIMKKNSRIHTNRKELFQKYGEIVQSLRGKFITGCDMGVYQQDIEIAKQNTSFLTGISKTNKDELSILTAIGVQKAINEIQDSNIINKPRKKTKVLIQGFGKVGKILAEELLESGFIVFVLEKDNNKLKKIINSNFKIITNRYLMTMQFDIFAPCAIGGVITREIANNIKCSAICGAANNPLLHESFERILIDRNILYIPGYLANSGGVSYAAQSFNNKISFEYLKNIVKKRISKLTKKLILNFNNEKSLSTEYLENFLKKEEQ